MHYQHITRDERVKIEGWRQAGESNKEIGRLLGRKCSTIGRELKRNGKVYSAKKAEKRRLEVRRMANEERRKIVTGSALAKRVEEGIKKYWSPEQVSGRMKKEHPNELSVCHETIYKYIFNERPELKKFLRCRKGKYRRRYGTGIREIGRAHV